MPIVAIPEVINVLGTDSLRVAGVLTDNATFKQGFDVTFSGPVTREQVRARLAGLVAVKDAQETLRGVLAVGVAFDLTPETPAPPKPPVVDPPTQDELDERAFGAAVVHYRRVRLAYDLSLVTDKDVSAAQADLKARYKSGYERLLETA